MSQHRETPGESAGENPGDRHGSTQVQHQAGHDDHGNTPAAWATVIVALLGFLVGSIGLMTYSMTVFWVGVALVPVAVVVGLVMSKMGYGASR